MRDIVLVAMLCMLAGGCATTGQLGPVADTTQLTPGNALIEVRYGWGVRDPKVRIFDGESEKSPHGGFNRGDVLSWQRPAGRMCLLYLPYLSDARLWSVSDCGLKKLCRNVGAGKTYRVLVVPGNYPCRLKLVLDK